ncbi:DUF2335 domain-containing protein [Leuconostoc mesenteroides]|uniref:DUF2335 domain-containing protein n=1 Tax=Leuconostoc mesenteroides TaxID=1245 RepID=UPI0021A54E97|nr:DUF2335 domain-containing protein [Leuconostoc mesenteroides]MCT3038361.1 DUF2335 domain-containing protein [Leuconostoc mesenteroides]
MTTNMEETTEVSEAVDKVVKLPEEEKNQAFLMLNAQINNYGGMVPDPDVLEKYNKMVPGIAEKYFDNVFEESKYRRDIVKTQQKSNNTYRMVGLIFGFLFGAMLIYASAFLLYHGHPVAGGILGATVLLGGLGIFVNDTNGSDDKKENDPKK